jgi:hypothetical protein
MEHHERRQYNLEMAQAIGRIEGKLDSLCGPEGRVTKLENAQTRQWWLTAVVVPILAVAHAFARKMGVNI